MTRSGRLALLIVLVPSLFSCNAIRQQKGLAPVPDSALFRNLQVLPRGLTREQLMTTMRGFSNALNVHCDHCHLQTSQVDDEFDFISDVKPAKSVARSMIRMTDTINAETILKVNADAHEVTCATCHRGKKIPEG